MGKKRILGLASVLVILGSLASLFVTLHGLPPDLDRRPHRALGRRVASEAVKLGGSGAKVILITRDTSLFRNPALDTIIQAFRETVAQAGVPIALTHSIKIDPLRVTAVPPGDFLQILKKAASSDVVVSFLGPPVLSDDQVAGLAGKAPKLLAVCSGGMGRRIHLKRVFEQGLMEVAILDKEAASKAGPPGDNLDTWFDQFFMVVTTANQADLPAPVTNRP